MRLVRYTAETDTPRIGVLENSDVIDLQRAGEAAGAEVPATMEAFLAESDWQATAERLVDEADPGSDAVREESEVALAAPVGSPQKIVCVGLNYIEHIEESDGEEPDNPILFAKFPSAIVGPGDDISWDPDLTSEVDYETELAVVMGDRARRIDRSEAADRIAGYTAANDVSARDLQFADDQWVRGKTLDTFCPLGPSIVTGDELGDPHDLDIWCDLNGERYQESNTEDMLFDCYDLVSFCSEAFTLLPGDVILTGTPPGVGAFQEPEPVYLEDGDEVTVGLESIGELTNPCSYL